MIRMVLGAMIALSQAFTPTPWMLLLYAGVALTVWGYVAATRKDARR